MTKNVTKVCYLCGKPGADSKDHVPPKCFLPEAEYQKYQRITVPAHRECNSASSDDEEYVRDLLIQEAAALNLPHVENLTGKIWRSWSKGGWNRYQRFIANAIIIEKRTPHGLYAGKALGIVPELSRVSTVCCKIARGVIFHDSGAVLKENEVHVAPLHAEDARIEKEKNPSNPYWFGLCSGNCLHDLCSDTVAFRRFYEGIPVASGVADPSQIVIAAHLSIIIWNLFCICSVVFPFDRVTRKDFYFNINTNDGTWMPKNS